MGSRYLHKGCRWGKVVGSICVVLMALTGTGYAQSRLTSRIIQNAERIDRDQSRGGAPERVAERAVQSLLREIQRPNESVRTPESRGVMSDRILASVRGETLSSSRVETPPIQPREVAMRIMERDPQSASLTSKQFEKEIAKAINDNLNLGRSFEVKDSSRHERSAFNLDRKDKTVDNAKERRVNELALIVRNSSPIQGISAFVKEKNAHADRVARADRREGQKGGAVAAVADDKKATPAAKDNDKKEEKEDKKDKK